MNGAQSRRIAPEDAGHAAQTERGDIFANKRARIRAVIDEQREDRPALQRLNAECSRPGKQVEHASAGNWVATAAVRRRYASVPASPPLFRTAVTT